MYGKKKIKFTHKKTTTLDILAEFLLDVYSIVCVQSSLCTRHRRLYTSRRQYRANIYMYTFIEAVNALIFSV